MPLRRTERAVIIILFIKVCWMHLSGEGVNNQWTLGILRNSNMLDEEMICRIFDSFCVVCIRNEWIRWLREQQRIADREINIESAATKYPELFISLDVYPSESTIFDVQGIKIAITNDDLAEGLNKLSEYSRNVRLC